MDANETSRQASSNDTNLDHQLDTDGFAIRILLDTFGMNLSYTPIFDFVL